MTGWTPASIGRADEHGVHYYPDPSGRAWACGALVIVPLHLGDRGRAWFWQHAVLSPDLYDLRTADEEEAKRLATLAAHAAVDRLKAALPPLPGDP